MVFHFSALGLAGRRKYGLWIRQTAMRRSCDGGNAQALRGVCVCGGGGWGLH